MNDLVLVLHLGVGAAMLLALWRLLRGPRLADRVIALDLLATIAVGFLALRAAETGHWLYLDIALGIGLIGFVGTVAWAAFVEQRAREAQGEEL
ncbi:MAG: cation:proton antiporter [Planctomycetota bacterium]|nr:cation:proton antiporter [Planctomycetota bacterium]MCX8039955.1 cation:proton antiporter [Planctomycetota bacterium]MDW8372974.1 cation:proton antiporter [Planctomycetota bacterium]